MVEGARRSRVFSKYRIICINYVSLLHGFAVVMATIRDGKGKREKNKTKNGICAEKKMGIN